MRRVLAIAVAWLLLPAAGRAHRLDEYLQATRLGVERDGVNVEIDLTPGVAVADAVLAWIDTDRSGVVSPGEADAYAQCVLDGITLDVDGRRETLVLQDRQMPRLDEMREGTGTIRLRARASTPMATAGGHRLVYRNLHRPEVSVYLVNALLPDSQTLAITGQQRDVQQHEIRLDYQIDSMWTPSISQQRWVAATGATSLLVALAWHRRRRGVTTGCGPRPEENVGAAGVGG